MTSDEITLDLVGQNVNGIHVIKLTDGTLETTFKHYIYGWRDKKNTLIRDELSGKAITTTSREMLHSNEQRGSYGMCGPALLKTLPDADDKRVWWDASPKYVTKNFKNKDGIAATREDYVPVGKNMVVGTWDEFLEVVNANEAVNTSGKKVAVDDTSESPPRCDECGKLATGGQGQPGGSSKYYCDEHSPSLEVVKKKGGRRKR